MKRMMIKSGVASMALVAALTSSALAQDATDILNEQLQLGDVFGHMDVVVTDDTAGDASSTGLAYGNVVSVDVNRDANVESTQGLHGSVDARATLNTTGHDVSGTASALSTAYGNSGMVMSDGAAVDATLSQYADENESITATTRVNIRSAGAISAASVSTANTIASSVEDGGDLQALVSQVSQSDVTADTMVSTCCGGTDTVASATAVTNAYDASADSSRNRHDVYQTSQGDQTRANTSVTQYSGENVTAVSTSSANSLVVNSAWGYSDLEGNQDNQSQVVATTELNLDNWDGTAAASSYGVGNSALTYNIGSPTDVALDQFNSGDVYASTDFNGTGGAGGTAISSTTAIGNAFTGTVCATCGSNGVVGGSINQVNNGNVYAYGNTNVGGTGGIAASAAAIGNSATFSTYGNGTGN
mgnify:CR=1 FL=1